MRALAFVAASLAACIDARSESPPLDEPEPEHEPWGVPITGGTMAITRDNARVVVADPDRDRVGIAAIDDQRVLTTIELAAGSEPGRVIEDDAGRIHVALRGSGQLLTITGDSHELRAICGEPRGLAAQGELVHVACATGELVTLPAGGGAPTRVLYLDRDLRDVIARPADALAVTTFRTAELIELDAQGAIVRRVRPPTVQRIEIGGGGPLFATGDMVDAVAAVAWRTIALPDGRIVMSHQRRVGTTLQLSAGGYDAACGGPVESALTIFGTDGVVFAVAPPVRGALPVDIAVDPVSGSLAIAMAGSQRLGLVPASALTTPDDDDCPPAATGATVAQTDVATAVAYRADGQLFAYMPATAAVAAFSGQLTRYVHFGGEIGVDAGRMLFHREAPVGVACASCHPEARDDGGVWTFEGLGVRRTQNLAGGILARGPYHWGADMPSLPILLDDVFARRMGAGVVSEDDALALGEWLDRVQAPRGVVRDEAAVQRGQAVFMAQEVGCANCHVGPLYTNNKLADVGLGAVKVPSLVGVGGRAPYMHDGCAATLRDRFGTCGGGNLHGNTSQLTPAQIDDLVAYLESL